MTLKWVWNDGLRVAKNEKKMSLLKAGQVFDAARAPADTVVYAQPTRTQQLVRVHDLEYIRDVLDGR